MPVETKPDGDRRGGLEDPFGFTWWVVTQVKNASREEIQRWHDEQVKNENSVG